MGTLTWNPPVTPESSSQGYQAFVRAQLDSVLAANPDSDAILRIGRSDFSLLALQGYALYVPGFNGDWQEYGRIYGLYVIVPGCEIVDGLGMRFCQAARAYAERYNTVILRHLPQPWPGLPPNHDL
jgi:hypothetical protein